MLNAREKELFSYEEKCENALKMVNVLIGKIEDMKLDIAVQKAVTFVTDKAVEAGEV